MSKMENCESETPRKKRPFLEVSISPDGKAAMNTSDLRDVLGDILDQKLEDHLKSIKDDFVQLKTSAKTQQLETSQAISDIKRECEEVKAENNLLRKQVLKLESFQRKNNLKLVGLKEIKVRLLRLLCSLYLMNFSRHPIDLMREHWNVSIDLAHFKMAKGEMFWQGLLILKIS